MGSNSNRSRNIGKQQQKKPRLLCTPRKLQFMPVTVDSKAERKMGVAIAAKAGS